MTTRRDFLVTAATGLTLGFFLPQFSRLGSSAIATAEASGPASVNTWLTIGTDESITLTIGSSEMGQGSFSGLAQILAEDLMIDYTRVIGAQGGPTLASPAPVGTAINTVGSSVTRTNFWRMRDTAAAAPTPEATTGLLAAMASRIERGSPSKSEGRTNRSQQASKSGTSCR